MQWGLVNEVVEAEELAATVEGMAEKLAMGGRMALYQAKRCLNHSLDMDLNRGLEYESECFTTCFASGEPAAGLKSFTAPAAEESAPEPPEEKPTPEIETEEDTDKESAEEAAPAVAEADEPEKEEQAREDGEDEDDIFE